MKNKIDLKLILTIINSILVGIFLLNIGIFTYHLLRLNILPIKYLIIGYSFVFIIIALLIYFLFSKNKKISKVIAIIFTLCLSIIPILGTKYLEATYDFFKEARKEYDTLTYSVLVLQNSNYNTIYDLKDTNILYLEDSYKEDIKNKLENNISFKECLNNSFGEIPDMLLNGKVNALVLEESYITLANEEIENFEESVKVIYTFDLQVRTPEIEKENPIDVTLEPFILYISGIDQYGNVNSVRGRSDVNQLLVVNPKTNHILIVNTPRDYYVQLAGTTGLKDKLTHAGIYGIDKSIKTLENFYNINIQYYLRVNFNSLVKIVDIIDGIDINSDKAFKTKSGINVEKGWNHFNGLEALAYSRARKVYLTGDHHRGANQQQVISAIIEKITSSKVLISKYNSILNALEGSFQTDMSMNEITSFIKYQLDKMPKWKIDSYAVTGSNSNDYTYSMGSKYLLYVMEPDMKSVEIAKEKMTNILNEQ